MKWSSEFALTICNWLLTCGIESLFQKEHIFNKCKILRKIIVWPSSKVRTSTHQNFKILGTAGYWVPKKFQKFGTAWYRILRKFQKIVPDSSKKKLVAMRTGYRPHKKLLVPMFSWYMREKNFMNRWLPGTGEIKNCE